MSLGRFRPAPQRWKARLGRAAPLARRPRAFNPPRRRPSSGRLASRLSDADEWPLGLELAAEHRNDPAGVLNALHLDVDPVPPRSENLTGYGLALKRHVIRRFDGASEPLDQEIVKLHSGQSARSSSRAVPWPVILRPIAFFWQISSSC
jgi:hypothetical protein